MCSPLFNFKLRPLKQIYPWGEPHDPNLHWFGLTDGHYWIQVGNNKLFEYSSIAQAHEAPYYCDYQVVRLYEDVIELAPYALEPVPEELHRYIGLNESKPWNHYWKKWCEAINPNDESEETINLLDNAGSWIGCRTLDSNYLTPSTNVVFWSDQEFVHIEWDNREKFFEGGLAWTAGVGRWQLPRMKFMDEVRSFHSRLMEQMAVRVSQVASGSLPARIRVDLESLYREQQYRSQSVERNLDLPNPPTDWLAVIEAIRVLEERQ